MIQLNSARYAQLMTHDSESFVSQIIEADDIIDLLKRSLQFKQVCQQILSQRIIDRAAQNRGLNVSAEEIQAEADRQRRALRLERASDALAWLVEQQVSPEDWEQGIYAQVLSQKLKRAMFESEVERFFAQNRLDFDRVVLYQIIVPYEQLAQEVFYQIEEGEISFYEAAHLYDIELNRRYQCGFEGVLYRWSLKPEIAAVVFGAAPNQVVYPVQTEQGHHLFMVEGFLSAELTPEIQEEIMNRLFQEWLKEELNYLVQQKNS